jgi:TfoX/Sxy family transcriptional regulator of competence genes
MPNDYMEWKKAPAELVEFITNKMKNKNCDYKKMFGYPAYFLNGNMFVGVHGDKLFLRLSDPDIADLTKKCKEVTSFEPMPGRPMNGYIVLPKNIYSDDNLFNELLQKSEHYVSSLPAKKPKKAKE